MPTRLIETERDRALMATLIALDGMVDMLEGYSKESKK